MSVSDAFLLFFKGLARNAPGDDVSTLRALEACDLPDHPVAYDLGAGTGSATLVLAEHLQTVVHAVDQIDQSLEALRTRAERRGIAELVETSEADFMLLDLEPESVDLIWCEGAIYSVGWKDALTGWRTWLRPRGYLVVSDAVWATDDPPEEALQFWSREYPEMSTATALSALAREHGFEVVETFAAGPQAWAEYYEPLAQRVALVLSSNAAPEMQSVAEAVNEEIRMWEEYGEAVDYQFFVLRRAE